MTLSVVAADVRNYLHRVIDDDFTINTNSNDAKAKHASKERSIRANWIISLPLRLELRRQEYEVGIISVQLKNVQMNAPRAYILDSSGGTADQNAVLSKKMAQHRIETYQDLLQDLFPLTSSHKTVTPSMTMWVVIEQPSLGIVGFVNLTSYLKKTFPTSINNLPSLVEILVSVANDFFSGYWSDAEGHMVVTGYHRKKQGVRFNAQQFVIDGFSTATWNPDQDLTGDIVTAERYNGRIYFGNDYNDFQSALILDNNAATYLKLNYFSVLVDINNLRRDYEIGHPWFKGSTWTRHNGFNFIAQVNMEKFILEPKTGVECHILDSWLAEPEEPLRLTLQSGGSTHPSSSQLITLSVRSGWTLKFLSGDGNFTYTFKEGVIFQGTPLAFYEFLNTNIIGRFDFLTPDVRSVNIAVKGLRYQTGSLTPVQRMDNDFLLFNLPLTESLVHFVPPPKARLYRTLEYVDVEKMEIEITSALDSSRSPQFHVGISDVTLHFREIWNNIFHS